MLSPDALTLHRLHACFQVVYNERAQKGQAANTVLLSSGAELPADLAIWTVGAKPNTEFLRASELASVLDGAGRVKVRVCVCHHL